MATTTQPCARAASSGGTTIVGSGSRVGAQPRATPIAPWPHAITGRGPSASRAAAPVNTIPLDRDRRAVGALA